MQVFLLESQMGAEDVEDLWPSSISSSKSNASPTNSNSSPSRSSHSSRANNKNKKSKRPSGPPVAQVDDGSEDPERSYVFLLCPPCTSSCCNNNNKDGRGAAGVDGDAVVGVVRVPFAHVVVGLVAHQLLLQNLARLMLAGSTRLVPR
jgi:hypothetical protein